MNKIHISLQIFEYVKKKGQTNCVEFVELKFCIHLQNEITFSLKKKTTFYKQSENNLITITNHSVKCPSIWELIRMYTFF